MSSLSQSVNYRLSELGEIRTAVQLREAVRPEEHGSHRLVQLGDVQDDGVRAEGLVRMDLPRARSADLLQSGDLLLRSRGYSYRSAIVPTELAGAVAVAPLYVLRLHSRLVLPEYVRWYLNLQAVQAKLAGSARGSHVPTVSIQAFAQLEIPLPTVDEQRRVVEIDGLLQAERALVKRVLESRERLAYEALSRSIRRTIARNE